MKCFSFFSMKTFREANFFCSFFFFFIAWLCFNVVSLFHSFFLLIMCFLLILFLSIASCVVFRWLSASVRFAWKLFHAFSSVSSVDNFLSSLMRLIGLHVLSFSLFLSFFLSCVVSIGFQGCNLYVEPLTASFYKCVQKMREMRGEGWRARYSLCIISFSL